MKVIKAEQLVCPFMSFQGDGVRLCITTKCMAWIPITSEKVTKKINLQ